MELNEKWKLTTQNNAYLWEGNQISKQNRYPWTTGINGAFGEKSRTNGQNPQKDLQN